MPRTEKYFIGPQLLGDIRQTVSRVSAMPQGSRIGKIPTRLQDMRPPGGGGSGTGTLVLGRVTAAWSKNTLASVVQYDSGSPLSEEFATPPVIHEGVVNKLANVEAGAWVLIGGIKSVNTNLYLVSAECEVPE